MVVALLGNIYVNIAYIMYKGKVTIKDENHFILKNVHYVPKIDFNL